MQHLEFLQVKNSHARALGVFFSKLVNNCDDNFFSPHPLTVDEANRLCKEYYGNDLYYVAVVDKIIVGYGLLRGWDEGYEIPSLGIAILDSKRGCKLGSSFMGFLHSAARLRGVKKIRIKVHRENAVAYSIYKKLGYKFIPTDELYYIGYLEL
jgi:ribosomal-protein-alanine N-acetyltransferase